MNKHENIINVNRKAYNQLAQEFNSRDERLESYEKELYTYISNYVKNGDDVLEIGSGTGRLLQILERLGCRTTAVELSEEMCKFSKKNSPNTILINQDILSVNFFDKQFDVICGLALIHTMTFQDATVLLKKVGTWLKENGTFIFDTIEYRESKEFFMKTGVHNDIVKFRKQYTKHELEELIYSSGFKISNISLLKEENNNKVWIRFACKR